MSYTQVCRALEMPTIDVLLRAARMKFLQIMTKDPPHHQLFWSCLLGKYEFEEAIKGNPWSDQFCRGNCKYVDVEARAWKRLQPPMWRSNHWDST